MAEKSYYEFSLDQLIQLVNTSAKTGIPIQQPKYLDEGKSFSEADWYAIQVLAQVGARLPEKGQVWENIALAERPFGDSQPIVDAKSEAIQPQGRNAYFIVDSKIERDVESGIIAIYTAYVEVSSKGVSALPTWMEIGQFAHEFRQRGPVSSPKSAPTGKQ